jgi:HNH endonuclease
MAKKKTSVRRRDPPLSVRDEVLCEAGYKCANPTCRNVLTLQLHHIVWVMEGGGNSALNLVALCGHCHDMHTQGHIPQSAIRYWKGMLHAMNHAFSKESMDFLLFLHQRGTSHHWYSADGVLRFAGLFAAGLVRFGKESSADSFVSSETMEHVYVSCHEVVLSEKGTLLVEAWRSGDEARYKAILEQGHSAALPESKKNA